MKRIQLMFCILVFCVLVMIIVVNTDVKGSHENRGILNNNMAGDYNMSIKVEVKLWSGFPPFGWILSKDEIEELKVRLNNLTLTTMVPIPEWKYVLITNENKSPHFPYYQIYVCYNHNTLIAIDNKGEKKYYKGNDTNNNFIEWLDGLIVKHSPYSKPSPERIIPPDTPRMGFIQSGFFHPKATVKQNTKLEMPGFVIFSEGTARLEGIISIPEFITLSRQEPDREILGLKVIINKTTVVFSIPPEAVGEGFNIEVDTSEPREIKGEIIIKSNDKNMSEIKIPIHYIILPADNVSDDKTVDQKPKEPDYNTYIIMGIIITTILLSLFVIYYKKFR